MSAITGIFYRDGRSVDSKKIKKMNNILRHRGPDGSKIWFEGPVAFGHQMLYTTPESLKENLPYMDNDSGLIITADARIDNREELSELLGLDNTENVPDSLFILKAYEKWAESCPKKLLGDFAFAIWDSKNEQLFCARDHMGIKPFYYYLSEDLFLFSTEIKALFSNIEIPRRLNKVMIGDYLLYQLNDKKITFYEEIYRIPNGHYISLDFNKNQIARYWELNINEEINFDSDEDYISKFKEIFFEAVKCRLRSVSQVGSLLSGGLDSSSIVCTAKVILDEENKKLDTFSAVFDEIIQCDERPYIESVLSKTDFESHYVTVDNTSPLCNYKDFFWHFDQPFYAPNLFMHWKLFEEAQKNGINIILDGFDGDTTLSRNNRYLADLAADMHWSELAQELILLNKNSKKNIIELLIEKVIAPISPESFKKVLLTQKMLVPKQWQRNNKFNIINNEFIENYSIIERYQHFYEEKLKKSNNSKKYHLFRLNSGSFQFIFELVDSIGGALDIEVRFPFFDVRLVEYSLSLPPEQKYNKGWDRILMRQSMENILPSKVQWRQQKTSLAPNFNHGLIMFEKNKIIDLLKNESIQEYINIDSLKKIINNIDKNQDHSSLINIWKCLTIAIWLKETNL